MSAEAAVSYATLILADSDVEITSDKLLALTKAAGVEVEPIWAKTFAKAVEGKDLKEILFNFAASGPATGAAPAAGAAAEDSAAVEEEKEEEKEESDDDMGMGLFD